MKSNPFRRLEPLVDALEVIESEADRHKRSVSYNNGENIALVNVSNIARIVLQESRSFEKPEQLRAPGSLD